MPTSAVVVADLLLLPEPLTIAYEPNFGTVSPSSNSTGKGKRVRFL